MAQNAPPPQYNEGMIMKNAVHFEYTKEMPTVYFVPGSSPRYSVSPQSH